MLDGVGWTEARVARRFGVDQQYADGDEQDIAVSGRLVTAVGGSDELNARGDSPTAGASASARPSSNNWRIDSRTLS